MPLVRTLRPSAGTHRLIGFQIPTFFQIVRSLNSPATRRTNELILEGIVTTNNDDGSTNVSPMGPVVDRELTALRLRPFKTSKTYRNLQRTGRGIFHITDDTGLLVRSALGFSMSPALTPLPDFGTSYLTDSCRWHAFEVTAIDDSQERIEIECRVVRSERIREFLGWNRAGHAVLEATILATRVHMLPAEKIQRELERLQIIIDKTADSRERDAFRLVTGYVQDHVTQE